MKKLFTFCVFLILVIDVFAQSKFIVNGIAYYPLSTNTVQVESNLYSGDIAIPSSVGYSSVIYNVTAIGYNAFENCTSLTSISIPNSVTSIGDGAFMGCIGLKSIIIPNSVITIGSGAFWGCTNLPSVNIPSSVTFIGSFAFANCGGISSIVIPSSVSSIGENAFNDTKWYESQLSGIVYLNNWILGYKNIMPENTTIDIKNGTTGIADCAFQFCMNLKAINIPNSVISIGNYAFNFDTSITTIHIPNSIVFIGKGSFDNCTGLTSINIPYLVSSIGCAALQNCPNIMSIYAYPTIPVDLHNICSVFNEINTTKCILYVPIGSKALYKAADQWKDFTNIVEMTTALRPLLEESINIYPNPITNAFRVAVISGTANLQLIDLNGRIVMNKQVTANESISVSSLSQGMYIAKLITAEGIVERKIVKK